MLRSIALDYMDLIGLDDSLLSSLPAMRETQVQSLGWKDPLEKEMAMHSIQYSCLENPMDRGDWQATV